MPTASLHSEEDRTRWTFRPPNPHGFANKLERLLPFFIDLDACRADVDLKVRRVMTDALHDQ